MSRITGRVEVLVNGKPLLNKAGATAKGIGISGEPSYELAPVIGDTGYHGSTETPIMAECEVTITDREDISLSELARVRENGTVIFRAAGGGKAYVMANATCKRNMQITAGEGETSIVFYGSYWAELQ
jgi:hypothetical protein